MKTIIGIEPVSSYSGNELSELCQATENVISDNSNSFNLGFNRTEPQVRDKLEAYWKGVILIPERQLILGKIDGVVGASVQLILPNPSNQTSYFAGSIEHHFVAPWARGHGLAKALLEAAEKEARSKNISILKLSVRQDFESARKLYESNGYIKWGHLDKYEIIDGKMVAGDYFYKDL